MDERVMNRLGAALARWEVAHQPTRLHAQSPGLEGFGFAETLFQTIAINYLGFAWRHTPFARWHEHIRLEENGSVPDLMAGHNIRICVLA